MSESIEINRAKLTNNHWHFSKARLRAALGLEWLLVINDFTAQAYAQINPSLEPHRTLTTPQPKTGQSLLVIGVERGFRIPSQVSVWNQFLKD